MNDKANLLGVPMGNEEMMAQYYKAQEIRSYRNSAAMQFAMILSKDALDEGAHSPDTIARKAKELAESLTREMYPDSDG